MFIQPDEQIIIMDLYDAPLEVRELRTLADIGIQTVYAQGAVRWHDIQNEKGGAMNFAALDAFMERYRLAGLKVLLPQLYYLPRWKTDDWYLKIGIPNYKNIDVAIDIDEWTGWIIERYGREWVQIVYSLAYDGEFPDHITTTTTHPFAPGLLADWISGRMRMLEAQFGEVWTAFHNYGFPDYMPVIYDRLARDYPTSKHYRLQFTHFPHGGWQFDSVQDYTQRYGIQHFVGSEYCQGLVLNRDEAMRQGLKFITAPIHPFQHGSGRLEGWMCAAIGETIRIMQNA